MEYKIGLVSLGCPKNEVDAELMLGLLKKTGFAITKETMEADLVIINTCGFITEAKQESINAILGVAHMGSKSRPRILVTGCLAQRYGRELLDEMYEIDGVMGTNEMSSIGEVVKRVLEGERVLALKEDIFDGDDYRLRMRLNNSATAFVKIAEGCVNHCSYCAIPSIRGPYRSRPLDAIVDEAKNLARSGVKEIILVAQEITRYGQDIYGDLKLAQLLRSLAAIEGVDWLRLLYCYPTGVTEELIEVIAQEEKVCKYIDLPLQHASDKMLRKMNRKGSKQDILRLIDRLRSSITGLTLRTTFIVGFPGETEADFGELLEFIHSVRFERAGVFAYSREEGTPAAAMTGQLPDKIKQARVHEAMLLQQKISYEHNLAQIGRKIKVLIEGFDKEQGMYVGRTEADAPEIDGQVFFTARQRLEPGLFVPVRVLQADEYDLTGELVYEFAK